MDKSLKRHSDTENQQAAKVLKTDESASVAACNGSLIQIQAGSASEPKNAETSPCPNVQEEGVINDESNSGQGSVQGVDTMSLSSDDNSTNHEDQEEKEDDLSLHVCSLCKQPFAGKNPLLLGCLHVFCSSCILRKKYLTVGAPSSEKGASPNPWEIHPDIPEEFLCSLEQLKQHQSSVAEKYMICCPNCNAQSFLHIVTESHFVYQQSDTLTALAVAVPTAEKSCTSCDENYKAIRFCSSCDDYLCEECVTAHRRVKFTKDHALEILEDSILSDGGAENAVQPIYCNNHAGELIKLCCETCNVLTCRDCQLEKHREHKYKFIKEAAALERSKLDVIQSKLQEKAQSIKSSREKISSNLKSMEESQKAVLREVLMYHYELHQLVNQKSQSFLNEIKTVSEKKKTLLSKHMKLAQEVENAIRHTSRFIEVAQQKQNEFALLQSRSLITEYAEALQSPDFDSLPTALDIVFFPDKSAKESLEKCLGKLFWSTGVKKSEACSTEENGTTNHVSENGESMTLAVASPINGDADIAQSTLAVATTQSNQVNRPALNGSGHFADHSIFERMQKLYSPSRQENHNECVRDGISDNNSSSCEKSTNTDESQHRKSDNLDTSFDLQPPELLDISDISNRTKDDMQRADTQQVTDLVFNLAKQLDEHFPEDINMEEDDHDENVIVANPKVLEISYDANEDWCAVCNNGGDLLCCDNCPKVYHLQCHVPALKSSPRGTWHCSFCREVTKRYNSYEGEKSGLQGVEQRLCERMLLRLLCHPESINFQEPVKASVPKYYKIIKKPMDLKKIRKKLEQGSPNHYNDEKEVIKDVQLMFTNCYVFNGENSVLGKQARTLQKIFFEKVLLYFSGIKPFLSELVQKQKATLEAFYEEELDNVPSDEDGTSHETIANAKLAMDCDEPWQPNSDEESSDTDVEKDKKDETYDQRKRMLNLFAPAKAVDQC